MKQVIYTVSTMLLLASCNSKKETAAKETASADGNIITLSTAQIKNAGIATGNLEQRSIAAVLKVNGKIDVPPQNMVSVSVPLGGYLKTTKLLPGMHVSKGEVIAVMEDQQYIQLQQDYLMTKSRLSYSQLEYDRQKELNQSKASSDKVFQQAAAELSGLLITQRALSEKLQLIGINPAAVTANSISRSINVYSPINGFVTSVNVNIGKYVSPTEVLFEMVNPEDIHLNLVVFEKDIDKLFIGQKLTAFTNNKPEKKYPCEILLIGKEIGAERNTEVHCHFEQYDKTLIPGTYMNAEIEVLSNNSFVLPEDAIVRFENKQYAFIKRGDSQFEMTQVEPGNTENGFTEILQGDKLAGQTFVTKGAYSLLMGLKNKSED
ncbi:MAG: efflux RND transporter periplasmic adaptor subunit [Chitinophagaceae bacterium]|nr:efflux RND transporter periplasmic adaptor subunit [Chitinophagaceae bacterium]